MLLIDRFRDQLHDRIKVLVLGDSGVGKSCFVNLVTNKSTHSKPSWTIGCNIEVVEHEYNSGRPEKSTFFIELWEIGGYKTHEIGRSAFYTGFNGIILVHDMSNRKSYENLSKWLCGVFGYNLGVDLDSIMSNNRCVGNIPLLVVATKRDLVSNGSTHYNINSQIQLNCTDDKAMKPASNNSVHLSRFFDQVIASKYANMGLGTNTFFGAKCE